MDPLCIRCKGKGLCGKPCRILARFQDKAPKVKTHFSGSSPPEIFVGRIGYPFINSGILAPTSQAGNQTSILSAPEQWVEEDLSIEQILEMRGQLIYGRSKSHIKSHDNTESTKIKQTTQELALSSKPVSTEVFLKKPPILNFTASKFFQIITNPAPIKKATLEENPTVPKKVDYLTSDYDIKATTALNELYNSPDKITTTHMQKLLSAGLLGTKNKRKMTPTRWSITAVDDILGKQLLKKIRYYQELDQIQLFHHDYNGNHFEVLLLPEKWSFEVIEVSIAGSTWVETLGKNHDYFMQDYEGFSPRKTYASNVVGAYYADRLATCEYLNKIKKQATVFMCHEERPEYYVPLGVGIIRESLRKMFSSSSPEYPESIEQALITMSLRLQASMSKYKKMSWVLENYGKQKKLKEFFN
tara:strand:- start:2987 stop:4231 length:1245 start_codon:yes stop_codon:yes gene_type:complete